MPPREDSPYTILGIPSNSDDQAIKKAYRKLALKWHPDKHTEEKDKEGAEKKFKKIAQAYEILSDSKKRQDLDRQENPSFARPRRTQRSPFHHDDHMFRSPFEIFKEFFGHRDPFQDVFFDDSSFAFPSDSYLFKKHRFPSSRVHIFYDDKPPKDENDSKFSTVIRFSSAKDGKSPLVRKTSTTTRVVDGKKVVTKKTEKEGEEIVEVSEDGELKSRTINSMAVEAN